LINCFEQDTFILARQIYFQVGALAIKAGKNLTIEVRKLKKHTSNYRAGVLTNSSFNNNPYL